MLHYQSARQQNQIQYYRWQSSFQRKIYIMYVWVCVCVCVPLCKREEEAEDEEEEDEEAEEEEEEEVAFTMYTAKKMRRH